MSCVSSDDHPNPDDPLYHAPRSVRSEANLRSNSEVRAFGSRRPSVSF